MFAKRFHMIRILLVEIIIYFWNPCSFKSIVMLVFIMNMINKFNFIPSFFKEWNLEFSCLFVNYISWNWMFSVNVVFLHSPIGFTMTTQTFSQSIPLMTLRIDRLDFIVIFVASATTSTPFLRYLAIRL